MKTFGILCCVVVMLVRNAATLVINSSGYEDCIFHLFDSDSGLSKSSSDLIDRLLTSNHSDTRQWTITVLSPSHKLHKPLKSTHYFKGFLHMHPPILNSHKEWVYANCENSVISKRGDLKFGLWIQNRATYNPNG